MGGKDIFMPVLEGQDFRDCFFKHLSPDLRNSLAEMPQHQEIPFLGTHACRVMIHQGWQADSPI